MRITSLGRVEILRQLAMPFALLVAWALVPAPAQGQTLVSIAVTPASASVPSGLTQQFTATGTYSDGSTQNLTSSVTWSSTSTAVAGINSVGLVTGLVVGSTTIEAVSGSISGSAELTVTASGLVGYWTFNDGSGTTAADSTGDGYTASLVNGVSWVAGKMGDAVSANGVNQYVSIPAVNLSATNAVTWTAWVNRTYSTAGGHTLFENSTNLNSSTTGFGFFPDDPTCGGIMTGLNGNVGYTINCYNQPSSGVWHHIAVVYNKSQPGTSVISLYIDGALQTPKQQLYTSTNTNSFGDNPLYLFSRGGTAEYTAGIVDDLRLYNQALSASQIQQIYEEGNASLVSLAVTPANASMAKGATQQFTATGTYSDGSTQNLTSSVTWTSTSTTTATINSAGLATGVATGSTTIQAASGSITGSTGLTVTAAVLVSIALTPANPLIASGTTQQFTATGTYSDSSTQNLTSSVTWSSTNTGVATISAGGLATGLATGSTTISATSGSITGSTSLMVTATLVSVTVTPANASIPAGATQQFTATGTYSDGSTQNVTALATWASTNTAVATITSSGLATGVAAGNTTIQASYGSFSGSTGLTVTSAVLVSIAVTPANGSVATGATQQFTATGTYSSGSTQNLTSSVTWSSSNTLVATINSAGLATPVAVGTTSIEATSGSITGSTTLTVTASNLAGWWKFDDGSGTTAVDSSGAGNNATLVNGVSWVTGKIGDAVSANGTNQYVSIPAVNLSATNAVTWTAWVNRTYSTAGGHTLFENSTNLNSSTTGFGFFPDDPTCGGIMTGLKGNVGYTINCYNQPSSGVWHHIAVVYNKSQPGTSVISLYIDGALQTPKQQLYTSTNTNSFGDNPLYLFSRGGTTEYTAGIVDDLRLYNQALSASQIQQIYEEGNASLVSLAVTPANASMAKGATQQFTATGTYSDGSTQNLTSSVTWTSTSTTTATINSAGLATGVATGSTTIQAASGSITGSTGLTVTAAVLVSIALTPANPLIASGTTQQFTATGTYSDSSTQNLTSSVTWSSTNTGVATISAGGLATGLATGSTTISATSGSITGSTSLMVTATLVSVTVTPANASIPAGATQQFTATGTYSDGSTQNVTALATWASTNTAVATITSSGLATGVAAGNTTIQASYGSFSGSTGLTVTSAVLVSIAVTPANGSVATGATQQFTATGTYSSGSTQNLTSSVTWSSSNTLVATINSAGLATPVAVGTTSIEATSGSITGSTTLTVTASNLAGWWKFDDGSGTTAVDSSGAGNNATLVNGVSWVTGKIGDAVSANGTNQYVSIPAVNLSATNAVTWTAWVNRTYSTAGGHTLFENSTNLNSSTTGFGFFPDDPTCGGIMTGLKGNVGYTINCYNQPSSGVWHHIAVVYNKSQPGTSVISLYIDGALQTPKQQLYTSTNTNSFGDNPLYLFSRGGTTEYTAGIVDDLRLYNQALSASQIQQIYEEGNASLVSLAVTPANASMAKGATQQFTATGTYSDGSTQNLTSSVTWTSTSTTTATINSAGLATGVATGSTTIQAASGSITGPTGLTVTAAVLVSIAVTPANASVAKGSTVQFTATGTYSDSSTQNLTSSVTWSSTNTGVATISGGLATGVATGTTTIQAISGTITGSTNLTVTAVLVSIALTPANASIAIGATQQFTATGTYSDGSTLNLTSSATWTSTASSVATINNAGLATGVATGTATIQATSGSISGSTGLTVTAVTLVSIGITPTNGQVAVGSTLQLTATGLYNNGNTQNLTSSVTWSSGNTAAATITSAGIATGVATGSTTIEASLDSINSSTPLTVTPSGLVGWWKFDDGSGTTAVDSSGFGNNATLFNGVSWVSGQIGDAVSANGANQYIDTPSINLSSTSSVTVAAWVNRTYLTSNAGALIEDSTNFNSSTTGFGFFPDDSGDCGTLSPMMAGVHGNVGYSINCFSQPSSGVWHHLAVIYDKTQPGSKQVSLYIDGVLQTPTVNLDTAANTNAFGNNPIYLFSRGGTQDFAAGEMDDLRLYNRALSAAEVEQIYTLGAGSAGATLESITVTPANTSLATGGSEQFTATGTYTNGATENISSSVTWTSTNTAVSTISSNGLVAGVAAGSTTIQAASGSITGSTGVTVEPAGGQFSQWASDDNGAAASSTTYQDRNATSGDLILVLSHWDNQSVTASVTDQLGNVYTPIFSPTNVGAADRFQVWYAKNVTGGVPLAITAKYSGTTNSISVVDVMEYSGLDTSAPLDAFTSATGSGVFQNSGNMPVTTAAAETIIGLFGYSGYAGPYTAGTGFNFRNYDASTMLEDQPVATTGIYNATASSSVSTTWAAFAIGFKNTTPLPPGLTLNPTTVTAGGTSTGTVTLNAPAPSGGAVVTLSSSSSAVAMVPASVTVAAGATTATFTVTTSAVTFSTTVGISATYGATGTASLTVTPTVMSQVASDTFNRANASTLGLNWTPLVGVSTNVAFQIVNDQIEPTAVSPSIAKEMYYGGLNGTPDQYSQVQLVAAGGNGYEGPAVRMTSNDTHYACVVYNLGSGNAAVSIILDKAGTYSTLANSTTVTVNAGDTVRCTVQGTTLTMTDQTSPTTLLTATDSTIPSGYPGVVDSAGSGPVTNYVMANWAAGASAAPSPLQQFASDNFNRANALNLGANWVIGDGHGPIQIVNDQIEPYPAGGTQPSKQHYIAYGPFPNDQWSQIQVVLEDTVGDVATEVRASDSADNMYVCDVNLTGPAGTAETRIDLVLNGTITFLVVDQQWSAVSPGDYIRGQVEGNLISLIDVTTGQLLLTAFDTTLASGYPGISMQADTGNPSDHIAGNWSGGGFGQ